MVFNEHELIDKWEPLSRLVYKPSNDKELDKLISFCDYLIETTGLDCKHPLYGLLNIVSSCIEEYEKERFPVPEFSPVERLKFLMDEHGLKQKDLTQLGSSGVVSEILSGKRQLNTRHIKALAKRFNCSPAIFM